MPGYRAQQVFEWVYRQGVVDPAAMSNLSREDRQRLAAELRFLTGRVVKHQQATDGTQKLLIDWSAPDSLPVLTSQGDNQTECVMIPGERGGMRMRAVAPRSAKSRRTACISSQVGCPVGCRFCASGIGGLDGNLTAGQIVEQVWQLNQLPGVERISNVVFMGMGEPLANFEHVVRAVRAIHADWGMAIGARHITVSTVGLPAQIRRLAEIDLAVTLAISLHAPNDEVRRKLIPWADYVSVDQLIDAGRFYFQHTGREVTLEYILLAGENDQPEHARQLAQIAKRLRSNVNLIRYNEVAGLPYRRPRDTDVHRFQRILRDAGVNTHIRASRGRDIAAACGQLRHEAATKAE